MISFFFSTPIVILLLGLYFIRKAYKPPKELEPIPTVPIFKFARTVLFNEGQHEIQRVISDSDPEKIGLVKIFLFSGWTVLITNIEHAKIFFAENDDVLIKGQVPDDHPIRKFFGRGISFANGEDRIRQRKMAIPAFNRSLNPEMIGESTNELITLLNKWNDIPLDIFTIMKRITVQTLGKLAFSYDMKALDSLEEEPYFMKTYEKITELIQNPLYMILSFTYKLPLKANLELSQLIEGFDQLIYKVIEQRKLDLAKEKKSEEHTDLLANMLENLGNGYTMKDLRDELTAIFSAGHNTTAFALSAVFYNLAKHPEIQKKAREEAIQVLGDSSKIPTSENIKDLKYIKAIIKESLRLYPAVAMLPFRKVLKPLRFNQDIVIPKGTNLSLNIWQVHKNSNFWSDEFVPERFINQDDRENWIPFSSGHRNCIGQNFSIMEQIVITAMMLLNFEVLLPPESQNFDKMPLKSSFYTLYPKDLKIVFSELKKIVEV
ncbi:cytochrome P450 [Gigaspora margarita]|uniref:Cytochrome P450 n=1 Tax=Gigaspora margarita TaxID=4874 RepID=A0A8H4B387_GIGMA|nr:cytochrome P450 [Gigaspora margarita]